MDETARRLHYVMCSSFSATAISPVVQFGLAILWISSFSMVHFYRSILVHCATRQSVVVASRIRRMKSAVHFKLLIFFG